MLKQLLEYRLLEFQEYTLTVASVLGLAAVYLLTWSFLRFFKRLLDRGSLLRTSWDAGRRHSLFLLMQYVVWLLAITVMLEIVGIHVTVLVAGSAALLVGLGLGVQQIFKDIVSGIFLLFEGTIEVGDVMQVDGMVGKVQQISLRTSKLLTRDGQMMIVPNHKFITENVLNWSYGVEKPIRFQIQAPVSYDADEKLVRSLMLACVHEHPDVINDDPDRKPNARLANFGENVLTFELLFWTLRKFDVDNVRSDIRFAMREKFRQHGINIASPAAMETLVKK